MNKNFRILKKLFIFIYFIFSLSIFSQEFYWDSPELLSSKNSMFPNVVQVQNKTFVFYQEVDSKNNQIYLSCNYYKDNQWNKINHFAGPYNYLGDVPTIFTVTASNNNIVIAVLASEKKIDIFYTENIEEISFNKTELSVDSKMVIAPRIFSSINGEYILFTSITQEDSFYLQFTKSQDAKKWSNFQSFKPSLELRNSFVPYYYSTISGDYVVFQAQKQNELDFYQLYLTYSPSSSSYWSSPILITNENSCGPYSNFDPTQYINQRPFVYNLKENIYVSWERNYYNTEKSEIWFCQINQNGIIPDTSQIISNKGTSRRPILFSINNELYASWFDNRSGIDLPYFAKKELNSWNELSLPQRKNNVQFNYPVVDSQNNFLSFVWQETKQNNSSIYFLQPDTTVQKAKIIPLNFNQKKRDKLEKLKVQIQLPYDTSGISGYSYLFTQDKNQEVAKNVEYLPNEKNIYLDCDKEGEWYLKVIVQDYAGNWSSPEVCSYYLDKTPPSQIQNIHYSKDEHGFVNSNSFKISWDNELLDSDVIGFNYKLTFISSINKKICSSPNHPIKITKEEIDFYVNDLLEKNNKKINQDFKLNSTIKTKLNSINFNNLKNGLYVFSIVPVDEALNVGKPLNIPLILNKFIPKTLISSVKVSKNAFGDVSLDILGEGFLYDGTVSYIYLYKDKNAIKNKKIDYDKIDLVLELSNGKYKVSSDSKIANVVIGNSLKEGDYYIALYHTDRGIYSTKNSVLQIQESGTVKILQDYQYKTNLVPVTQVITYYLQPGNILFILLIFIALLGIFVFTKEIINTIKQTLLLKTILTQGDDMNIAEEDKTIVKKKVISLKLKLVSFTSALIVLSILLVAIPLGVNMIKTQEKTLLNGLQKRIEVLLESISTGAKSFIPVSNFLELSTLPEQTSALPEAEYVTIVGINSTESTSNLFNVWATNDKDIMSKIDTKSILYGSSKLISTEVPSVSHTELNQISELNQIALNINNNLDEKTGKTIKKINELNTEGIKLVSKTDKFSIERRNEISQITTELNRIVNSDLRLASIQNQGSFPLFPQAQIDRLNKEYLFYRPIIYTQGSSSEYVKGFVLLKIKTDLLIESMDKASMLIFITVIVVSLIVIGLGILFSLLLSTIIVNPVRKLVSHVKKIGETKKKKQLHPITVKTKDEIGLLGQTINKMLEDLKKAEQQAGLDMEARAVQQAFLPLSSNQDGTKQTISIFEDEHIKTFGYYEGADGVSGDYFDYKKLDSRWYVFIKSDASGHGIPAALIMTIVALYFRQYFSKWNYSKNSTKINELVIQINEFINNLELKGKFVTLIVGLFDSQTGRTYLCNAGDNLVHVYKDELKMLSTVKLKETPAAGPFPLFLVDMKGGFSVETMQLQKNDILFLYTDGIEEATRVVRDSNFNPILLPKLDGEGNIIYNKDGSAEYNKKEELLESDRVKQIIESVINKKKFILTKQDNPLKEEVLEFDFTNCNASLEESIIALASVEKVFRMYKPSSATVNDTIKVDKKIDEFLKKYFNLYKKYCQKAPSEIETEESNYVYYSYIFEDEQKDDLTLFALKRM